MGYELCNGCSSAHPTASYGYVCQAAGVYSRYETFREKCCPCTTCLVKAACDRMMRSYPYKCEIFKKSRTKLFKLTNGEDDE